jgi:hypothetical protein
MNKKTLFLALLGMANMLHATKLNITNNTQQTIHLIGERVQGQGSSIAFGVVASSSLLSSGGENGQFVKQLDVEITPGKTYSQTFDANANLSADIRLRQDNNLIGSMLVDTSDNFDVSITKSPIDGALTFSSMPAGSKK